MMPSYPSASIRLASCGTRRRSCCDTVANTRMLALLSVMSRSGHSLPGRRKPGHEETVMPRNVAVGVGLMEFPFSGADAYWRWVDLCEAGGVDSIWQTDRLVSPAPFLECMSVMAALAGRTRRIKFGVNVLSLAMRDAVLVARQCATIDYLSNGRLLPAFGI